MDMPSSTAAFACAQVSYVAEVYNSSAAHAQHSTLLCCWTASSAACRDVVGRTVSTSRALAREPWVSRTRACRSQRIMDVSHLRAAPCCTSFLQCDQHSIEHLQGCNQRETSGLWCCPLLSTPSMLSCTSNEQQPEIVLSASHQRQHLPVASKQRLPYFGEFAGCLLSSKGARLCNCCFRPDESE